METGSWADWLAAVGTVGAFTVSLHLLSQERQLRVRAQAVRVSAWAEWRRHEDPHDLSPRQYFAYIHNASDSPIYVDLMLVSRDPSTPPESPQIEMGVVPAHGTRDYGLNESAFPPAGDPPHITILFTDVNGVSWRRDSNGSLERESSGRTRKTTSGERKSDTQRQRLG